MGRILHKVTKGRSFTKVDDSLCEQLCLGVFVASMIHQLLARWRRRRQKGFIVVGFFVAFKIIVYRFLQEFAVSKINDRHKKDF